MIIHQNAFIKHFEFPICFVYFTTADNLYNLAVSNVEFN